MSTRIEDLEPNVAAKAREADEELTNLNIPNATTATLRTAIEQIALYCQGRAPLEIVNLVRKYAGMSPLGLGDNTYTVTKCDGVNTQSNHQGGRALDKVPLDGRDRAFWPPPTDPRWAQIAAVMKRHGFSWGGDWADPDMPHYEMPA